MTLEQSFGEVYALFKLNFYRSIFEQVHEREGSLTAMEAFSIEVIYALGEPTIGQFAQFCLLYTSRPRPPCPPPLTTMWTTWWYRATGPRPPGAPSPSPRGSAPVSYTHLTLDAALAAAGGNPVALLADVETGSLSGVIDGRGKRVVFTGSLSDLLATGATLAGADEMCIRDRCAAARRCCS